MDKPKILPIKKIVDENLMIKTYVFEYPLNSKPGQFVMLWIPEVDEKPFSLSFDNGREFWVTVFKVGLFTEKMFELQEGDKVGIRGPYGCGFEIKKGQKLILVGGGCGSAPLYSVLEKAKEKKCEVDFILGARNKDLLLFEERVREYDNVKLHICTDDGSAGEKGFTTDVLGQLVDENVGAQIQILTCGPEIMMKKVSDIAHERGIKCQLSLERYMKCGFGICGSCVLDPDGLRVCKDGSVFDNEVVRKVADFGKYHRDAEGKREYLLRN